MILVPRKHPAFLYARTFTGWLWECFRYDDGPKWHRFYRAHYVAMLAVRAVRELERTSNSPEA